MFPILCISSRNYIYIYIPYCINKAFNKLSGTLIVDFLCSSNKLSYGYEYVASVPLNYTQSICAQRVNETNSTSVKTDLLFRNEPSFI